MLGKAVELDPKFTSPVVWLAWEKNIEKKNKHNLVT